MADLYANYKDRGLEIVGISLEENESAWKTAIEKNNMQWIQLIIDRKNPGNAAEKHNVTVIPFTVLIDAEGNIAALNLRGKELHGKIMSLLE